VVEQLIRNERVNGSNPLSGSPLSVGVYLLKLTPLGILYVAEGYPTRKRERSYFETKETAQAAEEIILFSSQPSSTGLNRLQKTL
jgi:hypothetical protein